jgi:Fic/DOC family
MGACFSRVGGQNSAAPVAPGADPGAPAVAPQPNPAGRRSGELGGSGSLSAAPHRTAAGRGAHRPRADLPPRNTATTPPGAAGKAAVGHAAAFGAQSSARTSAAGRPAALSSPTSNLSIHPSAVSSLEVSHTISTMNKDYEKLLSAAGDSFGKKESALFMQATQAHLNKFASSSGLSIGDAAKVLSAEILKTAEKPLQGIQKNADIIQRGDVIRSQNMKLLALHSVAQTHHELAELKTTLANHPQFKNLNPSDAWRMLIDSGTTDQSKSAFSFENEPGYMAAMHSGLNHMLKADLQGQNIDADLLNSLHSAALHGVMTENTWTGLAYGRENTEETASAIALSKSKPDSDQFILKTSGFRDAHPIHFGLSENNGGNLTREGFNQIIEASKKPDSTYKIVQDHGGNPIFLRLMPGISDASEYKSEKNYRIMPKLKGINDAGEDIDPMSAAQMKTKIDGIFAEHNSLISAATNADDKIKAIASCCAELERTHAFVDGNARTVGFLAVNKLLLESGLPPTMIENPNRFDGFSVDQLAQEIKKGQMEFGKYTNPAMQH